MYPRNDEFHQRTNWIFFVADNIVMTHMLVSNGFQAEYSSISYHNLTTDSQLFNILQQECYSVTGELKCHNL